VPTFQIGEAAELLGVSADTLRRWIDSGRLPATKTAGGRRIVEGTELARLAESLANAPGQDAVWPGSARNRMVGFVTNVTRDTVMAQVDMICGPYRIVSLMSREAADELGLAPGVLAVASVKATTVTVELPHEKGH
jgi:molybdopterin-binding protein